MSRVTCRSVDSDGNVHTWANCSDKTRGNQSLECSSYTARSTIPPHWRFKQNRCGSTIERTRYEGSVVQDSRRCSVFAAVLASQARDARHLRCGRSKAYWPAGESPCSSGRDSPEGKRTGIAVHRGDEVPH